ncbi:hypothetical protein ACFE04_030236 [Oxalis oulophora]
MASLRFLNHGIIILLMVSSLQLRWVYGESKVPCYYIFGDSLIDNGNNNVLQTSAKVNYRPYGIDFPQGPSGRFTNGRTVVDLLAQKFGFHDFIKPYANATDSDIFFGVNYASGAAGILEETGERAGDRVWLNKQVQNHQKVVSIITQKIQSPAQLKDFLNKCLYSVGLGSNDYINNYFLPQSYNTSKLYTLGQYAYKLANELNTNLEILYNLGARKISIDGLGPIGCTPVARLLNRKGGACFDKANFAARLFNDRLKVMVKNFSASHPDAKMIYINNMIPINSSGLIEDLSCCQVDIFGLCIPLEVVCPNRNLYMYWDGFHPTEFFNRRKATSAYLTISKYLLKNIS